MCTTWRCCVCVCVCWTRHTHTFIACRPHTCCVWTSFTRRTYHTRAPMDIKKMFPKCEVSYLFRFLCSAWTKWQSIKRLIVHQHETLSWWWKFHQLTRSNLYTIFFSTFSQHTVCVSWKSVLKANLSTFSTYAHLQWIPCES